jgi:ABC-type nickel/cobalt efflux system permease component RcnA
MNLTLALVAAAATLGSVHTVAPDHWVPFAALARAEKWSARRTALVTAGCGLGHVTVSVLLGTLGLLFGLELLEALGRRMEGVAGLLLIGFGVAYALWGIRHALGGHAHVHVHERHVHVHAHEHQVHPHHEPTGDAPRPCRSTAWTLFALFSADPCVAVIPLMFAAAPLGCMRTIVVVVAYEIATIATMIALVMPARAAVSRLRGLWADRWSDALAGGVVAIIGLVVLGVGV